MKSLIKMEFKFHISQKLLTGPTKDYIPLISILILMSTKISEHFIGIKESLNITHKMTSLNLAPNHRLWAKVKHDKIETTTATKLEDFHTLREYHTTWSVNKWKTSGTMWTQSTTDSCLKSWVMQLEPCKCLSVHRVLPSQKRLIKTSITMKFLIRHWQ